MTGEIQEIRDKVEMLCVDEAQRHGVVWKAASNEKSVTRRIYNMIKGPFSKKQWAKIAWHHVASCAREIISCAATIYCIWKERNSRLHGKNGRKEAEIIHEIRAVVCDRMCGARTRRAWELAITWGLHSALFAL
ncbi:hypothetical protein LIER_16128 [Lithospermum erythrorhizon]|uniref:Uncharacterized protein n=1 Tax=Lithospermum erythrorhizon TaxID=34254 RepID=A0AAV3Q6X7_LITER